jgi:5'-methylthioadenosine phosphorylase
MKEGKRMESIGIIGGSGFYDLMENPQMFIHDNKYGRSSEIFKGTISGVPVYFLPRHGPNHKVIVPRINYRANIWAFKELGVKRILATNCVGSSNPNIALGDLVIPHDFVDFTRRMPRSLYDDTTEAFHVDMTPPYCPDLRKVLIDAAKQVRPNNTHDQAVIFVNEGLRFETPYELKLFRQWGADLIGMTTLPEAIFAREAALCYAHICVPTNWCLGEPIEADEFPKLLKQGVEDFKEVLKIAVKNIPLERDCPCSHALDHAVLEKKDK